MTPKTRNPNRRGSSASTGNRDAFTLMEVLIALTITLILMAAVMEMFAKISDGINESRSNMDLNDQLRHAKHRLIQDLRGVTAPTIPPLDPHMHLGYFEYVEGPRIANSQYAANSVGGDVGENLNGNWNSRPTFPAGGVGNQVVNSIIGDVDDILMFTTASYDDKFVGRGGNKSGVNLAVKSRYAEVAWFLRRQTAVSSIKGDSRNEFYNLHRRQFIVLPNAVIWGNLDYTNVDLSLHAEGGNYETQIASVNLVSLKKLIDPRTYRSSLGDLTKRENRSLHQPYLWPYEMLYVAPQWGRGIRNPTSELGVAASQLSLPTLGEQSNGSFPLPNPERIVSTGNYALKTTFTPTPPFGYIIQSGLGNGNRVGDDIILTDVVGFDVKAWDPGAPVFRATAMANNPNNAGVLLPGDGGYIRAVDVFNGAPTTAANQPVAFGAFADLNYMQTEALYTPKTPDTSPHTARYRSYMDSANSALARMESAPPFSRRCRVPRAQFPYPGDGALAGNPVPNTNVPRPAVWDTWSTHYEYDGINNDDDNGDGIIDQGGADFIDELTNGIDDNGNGLVDEPNVYYNGLVSTGEQDAPPPYRSPLRGIKITIRVMEQDSKEVREVTVVHEFVPL